MTDWGFRAKKPTGEELWLITDRLGQFLGTTTTGTTNGSVTDAAFAEPNAEPFCFVYSLASTPFIEQPDISFAGSVMSWTWPAGSSPGYRTSCLLVYGVG